MLDNTHPKLISLKRTLNMTFNIPLYDNLNKDIKDIVDSHILYDLINTERKSNQDILLFEFKTDLKLYNNHCPRRITYYKWIGRRMKWLQWAFSSRGCITKQVFRDNTTTLFKHTF
jgi:hypothetical protein